MKILCIKLMRSNFYNITYHFLCFWLLIDYTRFQPYLKLIIISAVHIFGLILPRNSSIVKLKTDYKYIITSHLLCYLNLWYMYFAGHSKCICNLTFIYAVFTNLLHYHPRSPTHFPSLILFQDFIRLLDVHIFRSNVWKVRLIN